MKTIISRGYGLITSRGQQRSLLCTLGPPLVYIWNISEENCIGRSLKHCHPCRIYAMVSAEDSCNVSATPAAIADTESLPYVT